MGTSAQESAFQGLAPAPGSRVAVIGGCGGIGRALVEASLGLNLKVAALDLPYAIEKVGVPQGCVTLPCDVTDERSVQSAFNDLGATWNGIDALVFVAGIAIIPPLPITELPLAKWDELMRINLRSALLCAQSALPLMSGGGSIVTIASSLAYNPNKGFSAYVASKGGLVSFTKALAAEQAPRIRANVVAPSAVDTAFLAGGSGRDTDVNGDAWFRAGMDGYVSNIPLQRLATPQDVVGPILFLIGPGSSYITGQVIHVNGGRITP
jgi:NAD(P)-dependent dehydrogenase (short-subunit alcohol dehydrogenase family)